MEAVATAGNFINVALMRDTRTFAASVEKQIVLSHLSTQQRHLSLPVPAGTALVYNLRVSADGTVVAAVRRSNEGSVSILIWHAHQQTQRPVQHPAELEEARLMPGIGPELVSR